MDDIFRGSGGLKNRRNLKGKKDGSIPSSMGVRLGYVSDVERPPPPGVPSKRRTRRIPTSLRILRGTEWTRVAGDLSGGGALLLLETEIEEPFLEVTIELADGSKKWHTTAQVLRREPRGRRVAHHLRFNEASEVEGLGELIEQAIAAGETRLETK